MSSYYEILGLEAKQHIWPLPAQEVKNAYRQALLRYHPDKKSTGSTAANPAPGSGSVTVDDIALAYKTISDSQLRTEYDRVLETAQSNKLAAPSGRVHRTGLDTVDLDTLDFDEESGTWSRGCRCGDNKGFIITEADLEEHVEDGEITVGCNGCSLWLRVLFSVED